MSSCKSSTFYSLLHVSAVNLVDLPTDVFLLVTNLLDLVDIVRCRRVSRSWYKEFTDKAFLRELLRKTYAKALEVRHLLSLEQSCLSSCSQESSETSANLWIRIFDRVVARYYALELGKPFSTTKIRIQFSAPSEQSLSPAHYYPLYKWDRNIKSDELERRRQRRRDRHHIARYVPSDLEEGEWAYDSGLLVYFNVEVHDLVMLDLESNVTSIVPFQTSRGVVRRIRLKSSILIIEWAEREPCDKLRGVRPIYRHFATFFDVLPKKGSLPWLPRWNIIFRNELRLHDLGISDCWFSTHTSTHYAAYTWQLSRPLEVDEPIEYLSIWDISQPSSHRPSDESLGDWELNDDSLLLRRLDYRDLEHLTIQQKRNPKIRKIELDDHSVYVFEMDCGLEKVASIGHSPLNLRRDEYWERVTGVPFLGIGPRWESWCDTYANDPINLDLSSSQQATCWQFQDLYPQGIRNQIVPDAAAGIGYLVLQQIIGKPEIWIISKKYGWFRKVDMRGVPLQYKEIHGDERWIIIQSDDYLHIIRFDYRDSIEKRQ